MLSKTEIINKIKSVPTINLIILEKTLRNSENVINTIKLDVSMSPITRPLFDLWYNNILVEESNYIYDIAKHYRSGEIFGSKAVYEKIKSVPKIITRLIHEEIENENIYINVLLSSEIPRFLGLRCREIIIDEHNMEKAIDKYLELRNSICSRFEKEARSILCEVKCLF